MKPQIQKTTRRSFSKFIRHPELYPLRLQRRDLEILYLIHDYRFIQSDQIIHLIGGSQRKLLERLQKLFHHGYVERLADRRIRTRSGSDRMVYTITNRAAELITDELGVPVGKVNWASKNRSVTERHIKHTLMVAKFRTAVTLAAATTDNPNLSFWKESRGVGLSVDPALSDKVMIEVGERKKEAAPVVPDSFFALKTQKTEHFFYLEADRSTMTNERFLKKLKAYWTWWKQGGSRKKHGVANFRVLTVTRSPERRDNLRRVAVLASPGKSGSGMFWFACEKDYNITRPETVLQNIWFIAKDNERHSLLE